MVCRFAAQHLGSLWLASLVTSSLMQDEHSCNSNIWQHRQDGTTDYTWSCPCSPPVEQGLPAARAGGGLRKVGVPKLRLEQRPPHVVGARAVSQLGAHARQARQVLCLARMSWSC